jgi:pyruvate carboxylase subunit B
MVEHNHCELPIFTLLDGHQSLFATRMKTDDMPPIAEKMDSLGFYSMEIWRGATFDVMSRLLNENSWDRAQLLKAKIPNTKLQMLLRGQNLVGCRNLR